MAGGPGNPLGVPALYIGTTVYRIHGTNAPKAIGQAVVSSASSAWSMTTSSIPTTLVPVGTKVVVQHQ